MEKICVTTILLIIAIISIETSGAKQLIFVHAIYRHGARSPSRVYPNDPYQIDRWPDGFGQLTQIGMSEQYDLGGFLKNRYVTEMGFLNSTYRREEVFIQSSNKDRALQSAASNLAGFYPPSGFQVWKKDIKWQPIPIHCYHPPDQDLLLKPTSVECPAYDKLYDQHAQNVLEPYNRKYRDFYKFFKHQTGLNLSVDIKAVAKYGYSPMSSELAEGLELPDWVMSQWNGTGSEGNTTVWDVIKELKRIQRTSKFNTRTLSKLRGGYLLNDILQRMKRKTNSLQEKPTKMVLYSSHHGTMLALMYNMGIENNLLLNFSSCIMIELYSSGSENTVKILLKNSTHEDPYELEIPGCPSKTECPFHKFCKSLQSRVYRTREEWNAACKTGGSSEVKGIAMWILAVVCGLLLYPYFLC